MELVNFFSFGIILISIIIVGIFFTWLTRRNGVIILSTFYSALVVISAIAATKIVNIFGFSVPGGVIIYAVTFLITDLISEVYNKKEAIRAVWLGFGSMFIYSSYALIIVWWQPAPFWDNQEAFETIINQSARITIAGFIAFLISQLNDVTIYHWLKKKDTKKKYLYFRNIISTAISQLIDTVVFITIAFYGVFDILPLIIGQYVIKLIIAICDTPFIWIGKHIIIEKNPLKYFKDWLSFQKD